MKKIYFAGPYRGSNPWNVENNIRRVESAVYKFYIDNENHDILDYEMMLTNLMI